MLAPFLGIFLHSAVTVRVGAFSSAGPLWRVASIRPSWRRWASSSTSSLKMSAETKGLSTDRVVRENEYWDDEEFDDDDESDESRVVGGGRGKKRFRQHVNPLARKFQMPVNLPDDWVVRSYVEPSRPLILDIGCSKGGYVLDCALSEHLLRETLSEEEQQQQPPHNYLGLEIRPSVAEFASSRVTKNRWKHCAEGRVHFIGCNANVDLDRLLRDYAAAGGGPLVRACIQFPDPHFKKRNHKRRVLDKKLVRTLASFDCQKFFLQTDVLEVAEDMASVVRTTAWFRDVHDSHYLDENPFGVPTERENSVLKRNLPVYRCLFERTDVEVTDEEELEVVGP